MSYNFPRIMIGSTGISHGYKDCRKHKLLGKIFFCVRELSQQTFDKVDKNAFVRLGSIFV